MNKSKCQQAIKKQQKKIISQNQQNPCKMLISRIDPMNVTKHTNEHQNNRSGVHLKMFMCCLNPHPNKRTHKQMMKFHELLHQTS